MKEDPKDSISAFKQTSSYREKTVREGPSWTDYMISTMRSLGFASQNRFLVLLFPNQIVRDELGINLTQDVTRLAVRCRSIAIETQSWFTAEEKTLSAGPDRIMPYKKNTANTTGFKLSFYCGSDMYEKELFDAWFNYIQDPQTREFKFYNDYAYGSQAYLLLLPNKIQNFEQALGAMQTQRLSGYRLTEIYPYSVGLPQLSSGGATEPLTFEVGMMFRDIFPIEERISNAYEAPSIYDTGFPAFPENPNAEIIAKAKTNLVRAVDGFTIGTNESRKNFDKKSQSEMAIYRQYVDDLWSEDRKARAQDLPKAVDGRVVYQTPRLGGLQLAAALTQNVQGFFGASLF